VSARQQRIGGGSGGGGSGSGGGGGGGGGGSSRRSSREIDSRETAMRVTMRSDFILREVQARMNAEQRGGGDGGDGGGGSTAPLRRVLPERAPAAAMSERAALQARLSDLDSGGTAPLRRLLSEEVDRVHPHLVTPTASPDATLSRQRKHAKGASSSSRDSSKKLSGILQRFKSPKHKLLAPSKESVQLRRKLLDGHPGLPPPRADPSTALALGSGLMWPCVRSDEPLSILAYSLSSDHYAEELDEHRFAAGLERPPLFPAVPAALEDEILEAEMLCPEKTHIKHAFEDESDAGRCRFECTSYFALQFAAMRHKLLPRAAGGHGAVAEEGFLRSLAVETRAFGLHAGRSGAALFTTKDNRFVLKVGVDDWEMEEFEECAPVR